MSFLSYLELLLQFLTECIKTVHEHTCDNVESNQYISSYLFIYFFALFFYIFDVCSICRVESKKDYLPKKKKLHGKVCSNVTPSGELPFFFFLHTESLPAKKKSKL